MKAAVIAPRVSSSMRSDPVAEFGVGTHQQDEAGAGGGEK